MRGSEKTSTARRGSRQVVFGLCQGRLAINGEPVPVGPGVVRVVLRAYRFQSGRDLSGHDGPIPSALGRRILQLERSRSLNALAKTLFDRERVMRPVA